MSNSSCKKTFVALTCVLLSLAFGVCGVGAYTTPMRGIVAHRGASVSHPENTLRALHEAISLGAQQVEVDVRWTSDNALVLMHDSTLARTTNVATIFPGRENDHISTFTLAELKQLDAGSWKNSQFAGEKIPTLSELFEAMPANLWLNLDLKVHEQQFGEDVASVVLAEGREHQSILSARSQTVIGIRNTENSTGGDLIVNNMQNQGTDSTYVDETINGSFEFLQFLGGVFPSSTDIQRLKDNDIRLNYCCSSGAGAATLTNWFNNGIDFPLVDNVAGGVGIAEGLGIERFNPIALGDFDEDHDVDGADFLSWQSGLGGDFSAIYLSHWLGGFDEGSVVDLPFTVVPEPSTVVLLFIASALIVRRDQIRHLSCKAMSLHGVSHR